MTTTTDIHLIDLGPCPLMHLGDLKSHHRLKVTCPACRRWSLLCADGFRRKLGNLTLRQMQMKFRCDECQRSAANVTVVEIVD